MMTTSSSERDAAMPDSSGPERTSLAPNFAAPQHRPRPLPLFLSLLREQTAANPARMRLGPEGLRKVPDAPRPAPAQPEPGAADRASGGNCELGRRRAIHLFRSLVIHPANYLGPSGEKSVLRWLGGRGGRVVLLDWG